MTIESLAAEISYSKEILKEICTKFGNVNWDDSISIPEILNEHLLPHLEKNEPKSIKNFIPIAKQLFEVWQLSLKKPKTKPSDRYIQLICHRLREGYEAHQIVQAIVGLSRSEHHIKNGYTHIQYVVRSQAQLDLMIHKAQEIGVNEEKCKARWELFISDRDKFFSSAPQGQYVNSTTGKTLK